MVLARLTDITQDGGKIIYRQVDITNRTDVEEAMREVMTQFGRVDILINNAGIIRDRSFLKMSDVEWDSVLDVNLKGAFNTCKAVLPFYERGQLRAHY